MVVVDFLVAFEENYFVYRKQVSVIRWISNAVCAEWKRKQNRKVIKATDRSNEPGTERINQMSAINCFFSLSPYLAVVR